MSDTASDCLARDDEHERRHEPERADVPASAVPDFRRVVGVVRVLRGRLAAPCRCCSERAHRQ
jgi:hypothetical protein